MNEIILIILIGLSLLIIFSLTKLLDKNGLCYALLILDVLGYILSFKITSVFKMNINTSIIPLISSFTCLYILLIKYGNKDINKIIKITLYSNIIFGLIILITNYYIPALTETISINIQETFEYNNKILIFYPLAVLLGQYCINKIYGYVTLIQNNIFLSVILTYIISAVIYIIIYYLVGYINILSLRDSLYLGITSYIIGICITLINIAFIYVINRKKVKK